MIVQLDESGVVLDGFGLGVEDLRFGVALDGFGLGVEDLRFGVVLDGFGLGVEDLRFGVALDGFRFEVVFADFRFAGFRFLGCSCPITPAAAMIPSTGNSFFSLS